MTILIGIAIGVALGWTFPQPTWVADAWKKVKDGLSK